MSAYDEDYKYLTPDERALMRKLLSYPEEFPVEFKNWLDEHVRVNASISRFQVEGLSRFVARAVDILANETTSSDTYTDLTTVGPLVDGIGSGSYLILYGAGIAGAADTDGIVALSYNGATPTDNDGAHAGSPAGDIITISAARAVIKDFDKPSNTVKMQYRRYAGTGSVTFWKRWLIVTKLV